MAEGALQLTLRSESGRVIFSRRGFASIMVETRDLACGSINRMKYLDGIRLELRELPAGESLFVRVGTKLNQSEEPVWSNPMAVGNGFDFIPFRAHARLFRLRLEATSNSVYFVLSAVELLGVFTGAKN